MKKLDVGSMSYDELVAWAEEEACSPYLRTPPLKARRKSIEFQVFDVGGSSVLYIGGSTLPLVLKKNGKSRVNFTRNRAILKRSKMMRLTKGVGSHKVRGGAGKIVAGRSKYGRLGNLIGLNKDEGDFD
ncbi:hypothetical protein Tco_1016573 [Tanacetum coccineum]|uniref:Uncharacterized protein n=1 Tax=Tanacetum coccineum TaxID=301880 RepID=A0ABQ5FQA9_9ASTR